MPRKLQIFYQRELNASKKALANSEYLLAWQCLERAHILAQRFPLEHTTVHWKMLHFGIKLKSSREVFGQLPRLLFGGVKSFVGKVPIGNTGGSNVPILKSLPIAPDIRAIFEESGVKN
jgi:hypothetical protein